MYKEGAPEGSLLVNIPYTKYSLFCVKQAKNDWIVFMMALEGTEREIVNEHMTDQVLGRTINKILSKKEVSNKHESWTKAQMITRVQAIINQLIN
jgi:hypothetical protein